MISSGLEMPPDQKAFQIWSIWLLMAPVIMRAAGSRNGKRSNHQRQNSTRERRCESDLSAVPSRTKNAHARIGVLRFVGRSLFIRLELNLSLYGTGFRLA